MGLSNGLVGAASFSYLADGRELRVLHLSATINDDDDDGDDDERSHQSFL